MQLIHLSTIICGFFCLFLLALTHTSTCLRHFARRSYQQNVGIHGKNHSTIATTTSTFDFIPLSKQINTSMFEQFLDLLCWLFPPEIFGMMKKAKAAMTWREKLHQEFTLCAFLSKYSSSSSNFIVFFFHRRFLQYIKWGFPFLLLTLQTKMIFPWHEQRRSWRSKCFFASKTMWTEAGKPKMEADQCKCEPIFQSRRPFGVIFKTREVFGWEYPPRIVDHGLLLFYFEEALLHFNPPYIFHFL